MTLRIAMLLPCLAAMVGCAVTADEPAPPGTSAMAVASTNRLSLNRLSLNRLSLNSLSMDRLSNDGLHVSETDMVLTEAGRELLRYTVRCALPEGRTLVAKVGSTTYTFPGLIGLTPGWLKSPLMEQDQRWISACLLAHVNGYGIEVPVSLRGTHPALATTANERDQFAREEVSFFGNVFHKDGVTGEPGSAGPRMYSCGGTSLQRTCEASAFGPTRSCAGNADCALLFVGPCVDVTKQYASACRGAVASDGYVHCHSEMESAKGQWPTSVDYKEVITVYLRQSDFDALYPSCEMR